MLRTPSMPLFKGIEEGKEWTIGDEQSPKVAKHVAADLQLLQCRKDRDKRSGYFEGIDSPFGWKS